MMNGMNNPLFRRILFASLIFTMVVIFKISDNDEPLFRVKLLASFSSKVNKVSSSQLRNIMSQRSKTTQQIRKKKLNILGKIEDGKKYAVFSAAFGTKNALNYAFDLPLTVLAWKRIGYESIVLLVGSIQQWESNEVFNQVLSYLRQKASIVIFLEAEPQNAVMLSQVSRLFVSSFIPESSNLGVDDVHLVTTDADLWPLQKEYYDLPTNKSILSTNSDCCGTFKHNDQAYKMLPMANIGMNVKTWLNVTKRFMFSPISVDEVLDYFSREFGSLAREPVVKGENDGWYMDQRMVSILISKWVEKSGDSGVHYVPRNTGLDRIDRSSWKVTSLQGKLDAHILENIYELKQWTRMIPLLERMYGKESHELKWCKQYAKDIQIILASKKNAETW